MMTANETEDGAVLNCTTDGLVMSLNSIVPVVWLIIGTAANTLALLVFARKSMRRNSMFFYLAMMCVTDCLLLWFSSFRDYLVYRHRLYVEGLVMCRLHAFSFFFFAQLSSWLLVGANLDRVVSIISIRHAKTWCTRRTATIYLVSVSIILVAINVHLLGFIGSEDRASVQLHPYVYPKCTLDDSRVAYYSTFFSNVYLWLDSCLFSLVPFVIVGACNTLLVVKVFGTKKNVGLHSASNRQQQASAP